MSVLLAVFGVLLVLVATVLWTSSRQLLRIYPRVKSELNQVSVEGNRLQPTEFQASSGLLRSGPEMRKDGTVVTRYVLSDDAIKNAR